MDKLFLINSPGPRLRVAYVVCVTLIGAVTADARVLPKELKGAVIKVEVTDASGNGQSATGFLWERNDQVITSLHALLSAQLPGMTIKVYCRGVPSDATVKAVYKDADLAILEPDPPLEGCKVFKEQGRVPVFPEPLYTHGWRGGASSSTSRNLTKGDASDETLRGLVDNEDTRKALEDLGLPDLNLDIYFVQGPLGGGYSGAPIVDSSGQLVAVVDGGLDNGASDYNWAIPVKHLSTLTGSRELQIPPAQIPVIDMSKLQAHFSTGIVAPGVQTEQAFQPQSKTTQGGSRYLFVKTKTRSLADLANTSDSPRAIRDLVLAYGAGLGPDIEQRLRFDIYEDEARALIIAVPEGQPLEDKPVGDTDFRMLQSEAATEGDGWIQFEQLLPDEEGYQIAATAADGTPLLPYERGFLDAYAANIVDERCWDDEVCRLDENLLDRGKVRISRVGKSHKVAKFGVFVKPASPESDILPRYDYYSVAVRDNEVFQAFSQVSYFAGDGGPFGCIGAKGSCTNLDTALTQLSQLVAVHLTTFGNLPATPLMASGSNE